MTKRLLVLATTAAALAAPVSSASAATRHFEGTVVSVDRGAHTFRLADAEAGTKRIRVVASTTYRDVSGFSALRKGLRRVEVTARRSGDRWIAVHVERSGGGGSHKGGGRDHGEDD